MSEEKERTEACETSGIQAKEERGSTIDEKKLLRKLDLNLIPGVTLLFLLSFLDRSNGEISLSHPFARLPLIFFQLGMLASRV